MISGIQSKNSEKSADVLYEPPQSNMIILEARQSSCNAIFVRTLRKSMSDSIYNAVGHNNKVVIQLYLDSNAFFLVQKKSYHSVQANIKSQISNHSIIYDLPRKKYCYDVRIFINELELNNIQSFLIYQEKNIVIMQNIY